MGARFYDPYVARFLSPDSIIPDPANPQSLNRYSYVYNNSLKYTDPSGHFAFLALLGTGLGGAAVGGLVDLTKQLIVDHKDFDDVNWAEVGGAAAGGFVAGATLGLAPAGAAGLTLFGLGALGGAAGSQAQALTQAGLEEILGTNPQGSFIKEARDLGFLDPGTMAINAGTGAVVGTLGGKAAGWLRSQFGVPESASTIRLSGESPMVRFQFDPSAGNAWTVAMEGRVINAPATTVEQIFRALAMGFYDQAAEILKEVLQQGIVEVVEENSQP